MAVGQASTEPLTGEKRAAFAAELRVRYDRGESIRTIARSIGRAYGTVHKLLHEAETDIRGHSTKHDRLSPQGRAELGKKLRGMYEKGRSLRALASPEIGDRRFVKVLIEEAGGWIRPRRRADWTEDQGGTVIRKWDRTTAAREERARFAAELRKLYESGMTLREIAKLKGWAKASVGTLILEAGGRMRPAYLTAPDNPLPRHELAAKLRQQYERGASVADLATDDVGSSKYVRTLLREAGTTMRQGQPRPRTVQPNPQADE